MNTDSLEGIRTIVEEARHIVIIQADNPDADSLGSSLALEGILGSRGKQVTLYCASAIPSYLHYLSGWDRVVDELPAGFDTSVIVDASTYTLLERLQTAGKIGWLSSKPSIVLDHHSAVENKIDSATVSLLDESSSSTCELLYHLANKLSWAIDQGTASLLMTGILSDTQGLSNDLATAETYRVMADLIVHGVDRPRLEEQRRDAGKMPVEIFRYKAQLIHDTEFVGGGAIALVVIPQRDIETFSPLYNPAPLILGDLLNVKGVSIAFVLKHYDDGRITGAIRANFGFPVADKVALHFGGGGHPYASGFKITSGRPLNEVKSECIAFTETQLSQNNRKPPDETIQYTYTIN